MEEIMIKCMCGQQFSESEFLKHFRNCLQFKNEFKKFDSTLGELIKEYSQPKEKLLIVRFLLKQYIEVIGRKLKKNNLYIINSFNIFKKSEINNLKDELNTSYEIIKQQNKAINDLKSKLNIENEIKQHDIIINDLKNELNSNYEIIKKLNLDINDLKKELNISNNDINNYKKIIKNKDTELSYLKNQLKVQLNNSNKQDKVYLNEMMCVNFVSSDQKIHYAVPCISNNTFAEVEEKLYQEVPEYRETNNNFLANGQPVLRFKTISQNKIGKGLPVTLVVV